jgi:phytoene/squalene synthetase
MVPYRVAFAGMTNAQDVRELLAHLTEALEAHLDAVESSTGESDPGVAAAFDEVHDAFLAYEEALYDVHDEVVPMSIVEDEGEEEDDSTEL